jgi:poly-gamma-glutamate capsule biosynthesis protein CapA/YwtB (metallophosphatase superfamily)
MLALAGDTMLGRGVAEALRADPDRPLIAGEVAAQIERADAFALNLECCISRRGTRFPDPRKPFYFRAPPLAAERLAQMGVDAVTLANNHALDFGPVALLDTLGHLDAAGIVAVGAGPDQQSARATRTIRCGRARIRLVALSDHPSGYEARRSQAGIVRDAVRPGPDADLVLVMAHWGPNMVSEPVSWVRNTADALVAAGATLIAGHSAHVFHGVCQHVLFDLGDFLDDYATDPRLRNDLGLLWLVELDQAGLRGVSALPLALDYCFTRRASPSEQELIAERLARLCKPFGTELRISDELIEFTPRGLQP